MSKSSRENPKRKTGLSILHRHIKRLNLSDSGFAAEINTGTTSTPGEHLRLSASSPEGEDALQVLTSMFREMGIAYDHSNEKSSNGTMTVLIRDVPEGIKFDLDEFQKKFKGLFAYIEGNRFAREGKFDLAQEQFFSAMCAGNIHAPVSLARLLADRRSPYNNHQLVTNLVSLGANLGDPSALSAKLLSRKGTLTSEQGMKLYDQAIALEKSGKHQEAFKLYNQALLMGCTKAYADIGIYMLTGIHNMGIDNRELAIKYLEWGVAAAEGNAMNALAKAYVSGDVVEKNEERALELFKMAQQAGYESPNLGERIESLQNKVSRNHLHRIINSLHLDSDFIAEINPGTASTPGEHLRLSAHLSGHNQLAALKIVLDKAGIKYEEKFKAAGEEKMLIIRQVPPIKRGFAKTFKENYDTALSSLKASAAQSPRTRNIKERHAEEALRISKEIKPLFDKYKAHITDYQNAMVKYGSATNLALRDEALYFRTEILDRIYAEIENMKQLKESLQTELSYADDAFTTEQKKPLQEALQILQIEIESAEQHSDWLRSDLDGIQKRDTEVANIPIMAIPSHPKQTHVVEPESPKMLIEKQELLTEINRIKNKVQEMINSLDKEIPKTVFGKDLKTHKRNTLLTLSRNLYATENSSLDELRVCVEKYKTELAKCQNDAILRQGVIRKNCRNLIDNLSKDLEQDQHVFNRLTR